MRQKYPTAGFYVRDSLDGVLSTGPVVKELVICLNGLGSSHKEEDLIIIKLSSKDAVRHAMKLLENLNFEDTWL